MWSNKSRLWRSIPAKWLRFVLSLKGLFLTRAVLVVFACLQLTSTLILPSPLVYADTAPTLSNFQSSNWGDITNSETTGTLSWSSGNVIVVMGVSEDSGRQINVPTATGLSFSLVLALNDGNGDSDTAVYLWSATAGSNGSSTVSATHNPSSSSSLVGIAAYAFSGSSGLGNTGTIDGSTAKVVSLTRANNNSAVITAMGDWAAVNDTSVNSSPAGGTVRQAVNDPTHGSAFLVDWGDQGASGTTSYGITDHTGTVDMSGIAVEVKGAPAILEQEGYRWRADDGSETSATWLAGQDSNITRAADIATRLRMLVNDTGDSPSTQFQLEWRKVSGATDWRRVATAPVSSQQSKTITLGTDDAQQVGTTMTTTGATIGASLDATTDWIGLRFQNVNIPKGATVTSAFISVVPTGTGEDEPLVTIYGEDADNATTFTTGASNISNRTRTSGVSWSSTDLGATGTSYHNSSDLASPIQTIINRAGWATGNAVNIIVQGGATTTRDLTIKAFENAGNTPAQLTVNYTEPAPAIELAASANISASGQNTTAQLTAPSGKTTSDFVAGRIQDDENPADAIDITANDYTELEWSIKAIGSVVSASEVYEFRVTKNGTPLDTYSVTPQMTIGSSNNAPSSPTSAAQKKTDDTVLATGDWTNETSIKLTATVTDADVGDTIKICAEVDPIATAFTSPAGDGDGCSTTGVSSTGTATVTIGGLSTNTEYHWQIKAKDAAGAYSSWVTYGGNTENPPTNPAARDFGVDTSAPTGGTVFDGTSVGVDANFNDASLSSLSANWSGFSSGASGLSKYQYSIGTTAGGTDVKGWTDNSTTTSVTATSLTLQTSKLYYVNVRAVDAAGNTQSPAISSNGQLVLPNLSFSVSPTTLTFSALNAANSYTDTKTTTLTTSTNAYGGYAVRLAATDNLRYGSFSIADFIGGSYASPDAWQGGDTGFGYTSSDTDVQGVNKFQSDPCPGGSTLVTVGCYAPYSQTKPGDIVADHTAVTTQTPITNEQFTVTHRITAPASQAAGRYSTVLIYTVTAIY